MFLRLWGKKSGKTASACACVLWFSGFDKSLHDELDLMREAANYSQLRRNFADSETPGRA